MKKNSFADILSGIDRETDRKAAAKFPSLSGIRIPTGLALEQSSSEATALHKAGLASKLVSNRTGESPSTAVADLTGGLGIDCWAFSRTFGKVLHNEVNPVLSAAVRENFKSLGVENVEFSGFEIKPESGDWITALESFRPDITYIDPARRSSTGRKVFLIEDCSPNVLELLPILLPLSPMILLKLSPMADISLIAKRISDRCKASTGRSCLKMIQAVGLDGECKELLCVIDREWNGNCSISAATLRRDGSTAAEISSPKLSCGEDCCPPADADSLTEGSILLCPDAVLLKAGLQDILCKTGHISKLDRFTHLYLCDSEPVDDSARFCSRYRVIEVLPFSNRSFKDLASRYSGADVSAKNLPLSSEELKARIFGKKKASASSDLHIWGFSTPYGRFLTVCRRI